MSESEPADIRASDAERDETVERLRTAAGEGRLTLEELADRIESASSSKSRGELERIVGDLPAPAGVARSGLSTAPADAVPAAPKQSTTFGDIHREGSWTLPAQSSWSSVFGDITLDIRAAQVPATEITIDVRTLFGDIDLLVPEGVVVDVRTKTVLGDVKQKGSGEALPGAPRIIVTGSTIFGDVTVRNQRLRERLADSASRWLDPGPKG